MSEARVGRPAEVPALGVSYEFRISDRRSIVFQTHLHDPPIEDMNEVLDRMQQAATRQQAMLELIDTERFLARDKAALKDLRRDLEFERAAQIERTKHDSRGRGPGSAERARIENMEKSIRQTEFQINGHEAMIAALQRIIAGEAIEKPANANGAAGA